MALGVLGDDVSDTEARAGPRFHEIGPADTPIESDGSRFAVFGTTHGTIRAYDNISPSRTASFEVDERARCGHHSAPVVIGAGILTFFCAGEPRFYDLRTRGFLESAVLVLEPGEHVEAVGRHWVRVRGTDDSGTWVDHIEWRTGRRAGRDQPASRRMVPDLDRPGLARRLCHPIRRQRNVRGVRARPLNVDLDYRPPFALGFRGHGYDQEADDFSEHQLALDRCRGTRRVLVRRCEPITECATPQLGGGFVSWANARAVRLVRLRDGRAFRWPAEELQPEANSFTVAHTRSRVYASAAPSDQGQPWRVHVRRTPR